MSGGLPSGWKTVALSKIADINPRHPKGLDDSMPVSFSPMAVVSESGPKFVSLEERPLGEVRKGFTHFAEGDVLFAKITPCMENGKGAVATGLRNGLGCGTTELHVIRPLAGIDPYYLYRFVSQRSIRRVAKENFTGTAGQLRVPSVFIEELEVPLAPLNEQHRIVAKLEKLLGKVEACQQRLTKIPVVLKRFRQSVLAVACSGRLTADWREENPHAAVRAADSTEGAPETPESWRWNRLSEVAHVRGGVTKGRKLAGKKTIVLPYLRVANVQDGYLDLIEIKQIEVLPGDETKYGLESGDVLFTEGGDRDKLGRGAVWHDEIPKCIHQNHIFRARLFTPQVTPEYISLVTKSEFSRHYFFDNASQTVNLASINLTTLSALPMPIPPVEEQSEIVRRLEALFKLADQIETRFVKAKTCVDQITHSILAKAFRGELVSQDPNDEPASVLLERINAERTKGETEGKGGGKKRLNVNRKNKGR
jgi:type I restriction enzyme, S subunit